MAKVPLGHLLNDTLIQSSIVETSMIPYAAPFPEYLEVGKYCIIKERTLIDIEVTQIRELNMEGVEKAFAWSNKGIIFTMVDFIKFYNSMSTPINLIKHWLVDECKDHKAKGLIKKTSKTIIAYLLAIEGMMEILST